MVNPEMLPPFSESVSGRPASRLFRIGQRVVEVRFPAVMGILNVTPDSFYVSSRAFNEDAIIRRCAQILEEGASWIDVGGFSSRAGSELPAVNEELSRLCMAMDLIRLRYPDAFISVDTARGEVASRMVHDYGVGMINDISGGALDESLFTVLPSLHVPYVLSHIRGTPLTMQQEPRYDDLMREISLYFAEKIAHLHHLGVSDVIIDPGFGFGKNRDHNFTLMRQLSSLRQHGLPVMVGVSRKSMIYNTLGVSPEEALNGTTVAHVFALLRGADFLRVHDVKAAMECVTLTEAFR